MLRLTPPVSAYLVQPKPNRFIRPTWKRIKAVVAQTLRSNPHLLARSLVALAVWSMIVGTYQAATTFSFPGSTGWNMASLGADSKASKPATSDQLTAASISPAQPAQELPGGPSGQLLPPGTMAPDRTFANTYARGQCTWYVAGRRQIPSNWGDAHSWYWHATSLGWSVGTVPAIAAIAWTAAGRYGHVALVEEVSPDGRSVLVSEMNYRGVGIKSTRWVPSTDFKYIY